MNQKQSWNIVTLFLVMIFGLTIATFLKPDTDFSENENRSLAKKPEFSVSSLLSGEYMKKYEDYLTDQFILRDGWIGLKTQAERASFRQESNDIYFAKDDYLIEKHTGTFETDQAETNIAYLSAFMQNAVNLYGSEHVTAVIVPNAVDILSEKLPPYAAPFDEEIYLQRIETSLPQHVWFDSSSVLRLHREEEIYYRTDHHWKTLGAYYVFAAWAGEKGLGNILPEDYNVESVTDAFEGTIASKVGSGVRPDSIERFDYTEPISCVLTYNQSDDVRYSAYKESALNGKDKYAYFYGGNYGLIETSLKTDTGRRLLVIKDSYAHCFVPFCYRLFDEVDMVDLRYFNQKLSEYMEQGDYTDVLFLYNASGFAEDTSLIKLTL